MHKGMKVKIEQLQIYGTFHPETISPFSQVNTELSPGQITFWAINLALVSSKKLKSFKATFMITMQ